MNNKGQMAIFQKTQEGFAIMISLMILAAFFTPIIAVIAPYLLNAEIYPLGGITLFFIQAFLLVIAVSWLLRLMGAQPQQPQYPGQGWQ